MGSIFVSVKLIVAQRVIIIGSVARLRVVWYRAMGIGLEEVDGGHDHHKGRLALSLVIGSLVMVSHGGLLGTPEDSRQTDECLSDHEALQITQR